MSAYNQLAIWLMRNYPKIWDKWQDNFKGYKRMKEHDEEHKK